MESTTVVTTFRVRAHVKVGEYVLVCGDAPALGSWDVLNALRLQRAGLHLEWQAAATLPAGVPVVYKYLIADPKKKSAVPGVPFHVRWEESPFINRIAEPIGSAVVLDDGDFVLEMADAQNLLAEDEASEEITRKGGASGKGWGVGWFRGNAGQKRRRFVAAGGWQRASVSTEPQAKFVPAPAVNPAGPVPRVATKPLLGNGPKLQTPPSESASAEASTNGVSAAAHPRKKKIPVDISEILKQSSGPAELRSAVEPSRKSVTFSAEPSSVDPKPIIAENEALQETREWRKAAEDATAERVAAALEDARLEAEARRQLEAVRAKKLALTAEEREKKYEQMRAAAMERAAKERAEREKREIEEWQARLIREDEEKQRREGEEREFAEMMRLEAEETMRQVEENARLEAEAQRIQEEELARLAEEDRLRTIEEMKLNSESLAAEAESRASIALNSAASTKRAADVVLGFTDEEINDETKAQSMRDAAILCSQHRDATHEAMGRAASAAAALAQIESDLSADEKVAQNVKRAKDAFRAAADAAVEAGYNADRAYHRCEHHRLRKAREEDEEREREREHQIMLQNIQEEEMRVAQEAQESLQRALNAARDAFNNCQKAFDLQFAAEKLVNINLTPDTLPDKALTIVTTIEHYLQEAQESCDGARLAWDITKSAEESAAKFDVAIPVSNAVREAMESSVSAERAVSGVAAALAKANGILAECRETETVRQRQRELARPFLDAATAARAEVEQAMEATADANRTAASAEKIATASLETTPLDRSVAAAQASGRSAAAAKTHLEIALEAFEKVRRIAEETKDGVLSAEIRLQVDLAEQAFSNAKSYSIAADLSAGTASRAIEDKRSFLAERQRQAEELADSARESSEEAAGLSAAARIASDAAEAMADGIHAKIGLTIAMGPSFSTLASLEHQRNEVEDCVRKAEASLAEIRGSKLKADAAIVLIQQKLLLAKDTKRRDDELTTHITSLSKSAAVSSQEITVSETKCVRSLGNIHKTLETISRACASKANKKGEIALNSLSVVALSENAIEASREAEAAATVARAALMATKSAFDAGRLDKCRNEANACIKAAEVGETSYKRAAREAEMAEQKAAAIVAAAASCAPSEEEVGEREKEAIAVENAKKAAESSAIAAATCGKAADEARALAAELKQRRAAEYAVEKEKRESEERLTVAADSVSAFQEIKRLAIEVDGAAKACREIETAVSMHLAEGDVVSARMVMQELGTMVNLAITSASSCLSLVPRVHGETHAEARRIADAAQRSARTAELNGASAMAKSRSIPPPMKRQTSGSQVSLETSPAEPSDEIPRRPASTHVMPSEILSESGEEILAELERIRSRAGTLLVEAESAAKVCSGSLLATRLAADGDELKRASREASCTAASAEIVFKLAREAHALNEAGQSAWRKSRGLDVTSAAKDLAVQVREASEKIKKFATCAADDSESARRECVDAEARVIAERTRERGERERREKESLEAARNATESEKRHKAEIVIGLADEVTATCKRALDAENETRAILRKLPLIASVDEIDSLIASGKAAVEFAAEMAETAVKLVINCQNAAKSVPRESPFSRQVREAVASAERGQKSAERTAASCRKFLTQIEEEGARVFSVEAQRVADAPFVAAIDDCVLEAEKAVAQSESARERAATAGDDGDAASAQECETEARLALEWIKNTRGEAHTTAAAIAGEDSKHGKRQTEVINKLVATVEENLRRCGGSVAKAARVAEDRQGKEEAESQRISEIPFVESAADNAATAQKALSIAKESESVCRAAARSGDLAAAIDAEHAAEAAVFSAESAAQSAARNASCVRGPDSVRAKASENSATVAALSTKRCLNAIKVAVATARSTNERVILQNQRHDQTVAAKSARLAEVASLIEAAENFHRECLSAANTADDLVKNIIAQGQSAANIPLEKLTPLLSEVGAASDLADRSAAEVARCVGQAKSACVFAAGIEGSVDAAENLARTGDLVSTAEAARKRASSSRAWVAGCHRVASERADVEARPISALVFSNESQRSDGGKRRALTTEKESVPEMGGVGLFLSKCDEGHVVDKIYPRSPAHRCGRIHIGDIIFKVNGADVVGFSSIAPLMAGPVGTIVSLSMKKSHTRALVDVSLTRAKLI